MNQLREHIKKQISQLMEEKYPLPPELVDALKNDLKLNPIVRYVSYTKAAATVPPSYEIFLTNGASFLLIYEDYSLAVKIEAKMYYLGDMEELSLAKQHLNRILLKPQIPSDIDAAEDTESEDADDTSFEDEAVDEPEEPEA
tara:strand:+ start:138 stop:563 length:426 start_codon:yes stop_codon:yes gene_type:complete